MRPDEELWMKKMKEVLKDYSEPPAPNGWSELEKQLIPPKERAIRPFTWWAVAATLVLAVSGISMFFMKTSTADDIRHTLAPTLAVTPDVVPVKQEPETQMLERQSISESYTYFSEAREAKNTEREVVPVINDNTEPIGVVESEQHIVAEESEVTIEPIKEDVDSQPDKQPESQQDERRVIKPSGKDKLHLPVVAEKKRADDGKWSVAASFSNGASASSNQTADYLGMLDMAPGSYGSLSDMVLVSNGDKLVFEDGVAYLKQSAVISEIKHKQPVSFGLSVRKNLTNGFSVESGVTYTMLSSEGKSVNNASEKIEQKLHYVGIPVRGNWSFVDSKRFTVYLTAGGMVEKCVYAKIGGEKESVSPLQFSLAGGVGGQMNITNRIGLYIEPGVSYFFDDGSDIETIRKENPLNFNLQGGIRFTY